MGSSEIWDKYHECCIGNRENFMSTRHSRVKLPISSNNKSGIYPKFSLLYPCYSMLTDFCWCFHVHNVQIVL